MDAVAPHRHCRMCGTATPPEDAFCSPGCAQRRATQTRQQRVYTLMFVALTIFIILALYAKF